MARGPPAAKGLSGEGSKTVHKVRVFAFNHSMQTRRGRDRSQGDRSRGRAESRLGAAQELPRMGQRTRWQSDGQSRQRSKWKRVSKACRRPQGDLNATCWGLGSTGVQDRLSKALTSDLPDCPPACQAGDKQVRLGSFHLRHFCRSAIKLASPPASCGSSAPALPLLGDGGALISGRTLMRAVRGTLNLLRAGN